MQLDSNLIEELRREHHVHTLVLYGSRARGDATPESDVDVAGFADVLETTRDARIRNGIFLDARYRCHGLLFSLLDDYFALRG